MHVKTYFQGVQKIVPQVGIVECSLRDLKLAEPRPLDTSMRSSRLGSLNTPAMASASAAARLAVQRHFVRRH